MAEQFYPEGLGPPRHFQPYSSQTKDAQLLTAVAGAAAIFFSHLLVCSREFAVAIGAPMPASAQWSIQPQQ